MSQNSPVRMLSVLYLIFIFVLEGNFFRYKCGHITVLKGLICLDINDEKDVQSNDMKHSTFECLKSLKLMYGKTIKVFLSSSIMS